MNVFGAAMICDRQRSDAPIIDRSRARLTDTREATAHKLVNNPVFIVNRIYTRTPVSTYCARRADGLTKVLIIVSELS